jgi:hypothetical protein
MAAGALCSATAAVATVLGWSALIRLTLGMASPLALFVAIRLGGALIGAVVALALEALAYYALMPRAQPPEQETPAAEMAQTAWPLSRRVAHYNNPN